MKSVLLMFVAMALIFATAATRIAISENGYSNVLFAVSPDVPPADSQQIIDNIKLMINEASSVLYRATRYRSYFREVRILIPETWSHIDANRTWGNWDEADVRIGPSGPNGDRPYTQQLGGCGEHGQFIHFTPNYLLNMNEAAIIEKYGAPGKVFVHEWAHLRYGVFDEYAEPGDEKYPLFYRRPNTRTPLPNLCTSSPTIHHNAKDVVTGERCNVDANGDYDANCRFELLPQFKPQSSLMSLPSLDSVEDFCDNGQTVPHNIDAPNRHNDMCQGQSVWQVVESNEDFQNSNPPFDLDEVDVNLKLVRPESYAPYVMVLDVSGSMNKSGRLKKIQETTRHWILNDLPDGNSLAIVQFSAKAETLSDFVLIDSKTKRLELLNKFPNETKDATCIGCGLQEALNLLKKKGEGGNIVLVTDGNNSPGFKNITDVLNETVNAKIRVITIGLGKDADPAIEDLADGTGGKSYFIPDTNSGEGLQDALLGALTFQPYVRSEDLKIKLNVTQIRPGQSKISQGGFYVDPTVGRNTEMRILNVDRELIEFVTLINPNNRTLNVNLTSDPTPSVLLPSAESGEWKYNLTFSQLPINEPKVTVTTQLNFNTSAAIKTKCSFTNSITVRDASNTNIQIFAEVTKNGCPVVNATVRAYVEKSGEKVDIFDLNDNGVNGDTIPHDGVYSGFYTKSTESDRYTVLCQVLNEGAAYARNGFIASYFPDRDVSLQPEPVLQSPVEQFNRLESAGSFRVEIPVSQDDAYPPGRVTDLTATVVDAANRMLEIKWTAPGDDLDSGTVSYYEMKYSTDIQQLRDSFEVDNPLLASIDQDDVVDGSLTPLEVGSTQIATISLPMETGVPYVLALRAVDKAGKKSSVSNIARFYLDEPQELANSEEFSFDYVPEKDKIDEDPVVADFESAGSEYVDGSADSEDVNDTADSEDDYDTVDRKDDYDIAENVAYGSPDTKYDATELPVDHFRPIFTKEKAETESSSTAYFIGASCALGVIIVAAVVIRRLCLSMYREYKTVPV